MPFLKPSGMVKFYFTQNKNKHKLPLYQTKLIDLDNKTNKTETNTKQKQTKPKQTNKPTKRTIKTNKKTNKRESEK